MSRFARRRAEFNKKFTNRVVGPLSGRLAMWSIVEHIGRRSGKTFRTPVSIFHTADGVAILLPCGVDADWVRNLQAAGCGRVAVGGETFRVTDPRIVSTADAAASVSAPWRALLTVTGVKSTLMLRRAQEGPEACLAKLVRLSFRFNPSSNNRLSGPCVEQW